MELTGIGPSRELGDEIEFSKKFAHHLTGIFALTQLLELFHDPRQSVFGLADRAVRVVLALALEARVVFAEFLSEKVRQTLARCVPQHLRMTGGDAGSETTLEDHLERSIPSVSTDMPAVNRPGLSSSVR